MALHVKCPVEELERLKDKAAKLEVEANERRLRAAEVLPRGPGKEPKFQHSAAFIPLIRNTVIQAEEAAKEGKAPRELCVCMVGTCV